MSQYQGSREQYFGHISYSQHGEDLMIANIFRLLGIQKGRYLDLGAHHPEEISNTALLYSIGWTGLNVEANPHLIPAFREKRPRDITVNVGVGPTKGKMNFLMYDDTNGRNTFCVQETLTDPGHRINKEMLLDVVTLNSLVDDFFGGGWPDFVNMDLEGLDYGVLDSIKWDWSKVKPKIWCIEIRRNESYRFKQMMYDLHYVCLPRMGENLIFVDDQYEDKLFS